MVMRYNMYASAPINGNTAPGVSSGQAVDIMADLAKKQGLAYEWTEIVYMQLNTSTTYAPGYSNSTLTTATACTGSVTWRFATTTSGTSHALTTPLIVDANSTLTVTLTNDITMATTAPVTCTSNYFKMPSLTGVTATAGAGTPTVSPATDGWTA